MRGSVRNGFSIFETVAILVIVALLLLIVIPQFTRPSLAAVGGPDSVVAPGSFGNLEVKVSDSAPDTGALNVTARAAGRARPTVVFHTRVRGQPPTASPAGAARTTP